MQQFFLPELQPDCDFASFSKEESKHITKVLRKQPQDLIVLTDGKGNQYQGLLEVINSKSCGVRITKVIPLKADPYNLHIAIAPTKNMDRLEWFVEKATEIGIHQITPILCHRSERKTVKHERLHKIAVSAMKQSMGTYLPQINPLTTFENTLQKVQGFCVIAHCHDTPRDLLRSVGITHSDVHIFIGPEGDFTKEEVASALSKSAVAVSLGHKRLRTETAALVACQTMAFLHS
jgi:16S rRNA (uracil1498-N3)-methyltransferase